MKKLEEFFKLKKRQKRPDLEVLEEIEEKVKSGDVEGAVALLEELEKPQNIFVAIRLILRNLINSARSSGEGNRWLYLGLLKDLIPHINGISSERARAILFGDLAVAFYLLGDEFDGDFALKSAINLASGYPDVLRDILFELINSGLLPKAAYVMKTVRNRTGLDVVLSHLADLFYRAGEKEKALSVVNHIENPFHRAVALYYIATFEMVRDKEKALTYLQQAIEEAEKIDDSDARLELMMKLNEVLHEVMGEGFSLVELLKGTEVRRE
ncbi:hypothetical protein [Thermococcus sp.]